MHWVTVTEGHVLILSTTILNIAMTAQLRRRVNGHLRRRGHDSNDKGGT